MIILKDVFQKVLFSTLLIFTSVTSFGSIRNDSTTTTLLFKITSPNTLHVSYIFGTHHAFGKAFFDTLNVAKKALSNCEVLIKENLNIPGETAEDIINSRTDKTNWSKLLKKDHLSYLHQLFANSPTDFRKLTPTELHVFLNRHYKQYICLAKDSTDKHLSLDDYIGYLAQKEGKKLVGLETTAEQIALINKDVEGMPNKIHKKRLVSIINLLISESKSGCSETDWYSRMDFEFNWNQPCGNSLILTDRNNKWMEDINQLLQTNNCFIAVGLSHLMYNCSIISQLRTSGYIVTPISLH